MNPGVCSHASRRSSQLRAWNHFSHVPALQPDSLLLSHQGSLYLSWDMPFFFLTVEMPVFTKRPSFFSSKTLGIFREALVSQQNSEGGTEISHILSALNIHRLPHYQSVQFSSVAQSCPTLCNPMNRSMPGLPVHHKLLEFTQTHAHRVGNAIQPSHPLSSPSPPAPNHSQHQGLLKRVNPLHEVARVLEFQLQHQSFQWTPRTDLL